MPAVDRTARGRRRLLRRRGTQAVVMATTAVVLVAVAFALTLRLRVDLRAQILRREASALRSMVGLQEERARDEFANFGLGAVPDDWFPLVLETARLPGTVALRLFDAGGTLRNAEPVPLAAHVAAADWSRLAAGESISRLHPHLDPDSLRIGDAVALASGGAPLLEVLVPLREPAQNAFGGAAQYWIHGAAVQSEFAMLDRHLWRRSGPAVALGTAIVLATLAWAFRRLNRVQRELEARSEDLARANHEFSLAAKTSALGAITAHLIHGLKNPLAGLEGYVSSQSVDERNATGSEWHAAMETTQRIRTLVNEVVAILREEQAGGAVYRVTMTELLGAAARKIRPLAETRRIAFACRQENEGELPGRRAHLALLVLDNLLRNACEATARGRKVTLSATCAGRDALFIVEDEGPGLAGAVREQLFQPVTSTKPGGGGIGLVLSHQLAQHAGGLLVLDKSDAHGCRFRLSVPLESGAGALTSR